MTEHDEDGYTGAATVVIGAQELTIEVDLRGHFQPIDGRYRWYGRVSSDEQLTAIAGGRKTKATIRTPQGSADGELSDPDPWGRYRITGTSTPPFAVPTAI